MKRILCYGDSNTWGSSDHDTRIEDALQWPHILEQKLGTEYSVQQEGLCARVAGDFDTVNPYRNGKSLFEAIFRSATPLKVVVISLGTNDLKNAYGRTARNIYDDLLWYTYKIESLQDQNEGDKTEIIYIAPANFKSDKEYFPANENLRLELIKLLENSGKNIITFHDLRMGKDGVHYAESSHKRVAEAVFEKIRELKI